MKHRKPLLSLILLIFCLSSCIFGLAQGAPKEEESLFVAKKAFEDGFYEVSLGLIDKFLKDYPDSPLAAEADLLAGQCYFRQDKYLEALSKLEATLTHPQARNIQDALYYWIAEIHFKGNDFAKASQYYRKVIENFPNSSYAVSSYYSLGWCLFQEGEFKEAIKYFEIVQKDYPKEPQAQDAALKIIECLYNLKEYQAVKDRAMACLKNTPAKDNFRLSYLYFYLGEADYYLNSFQDAADFYSKVINYATDAKTVDLARLGAGWCYIKLERYKEAEDILSKIKEANLDAKSRDALGLAQAIIFTETSRFGEAQDAYQKLLSSSEDKGVIIQAYLGKADALYNRTEYNKAIEVYQQALANLGEQPQGDFLDKLHYGLAWSFLKEGEFKKAIDEFQKIVKNSDDKTVKIAALCQIGDAYQDSGEFEKASQSYNQILKGYPDSFYSDYVQYQMGMVMLKTYNYDAAAMAFKALKANFPNSKLLDDATYALALSYFQREDYSASRDVLVKFLEEFKESSLRPEATYLLGTDLYNLGKFSEAIEVFKTITRLYSQDKQLLQKAEYEIADCYYQMGDEKEAMARFKTLRSKYPDSTLTAEVMWWLGEYYYRHNELALARRYFSSLIQDFPKSSLLPSAYYALASTYESEGNYGQAIDNFSKVMNTDRSDLAGAAGIAIGDIYAKEDKIEEALSIYKDTAVKYPNLGHLAHPKIADIYRKTNELDQALEFYRKSLDEVPVRQVPDIQFKVAEILQQQNKNGEAIEEYLKVTYLYPDNKDLAVKSLLRVASIYEEARNRAEAIKIYNRIVSMDVEESKYAKEKIDTLKKK